MHPDEEIGRYGPDINDPAGQQPNPPALPLQDQGLKDSTSAL